MNEFISTNFKKKFVINLKHRNDRFNEFKQRVSKYFDPNIIDRFDAIYGKNFDSKTLSEDFLKNSKNKGEMGCFLSHQTIWKLVISDSTIKDDDLILVFEDDVFFSDTDNLQDKFIEAVNTFKNINQENKFLYLGGRFRNNFKPYCSKEIKYHWTKLSNNIYERIPNLPIKNEIFDRTTHINIFNKSMAKFLYKLSTEKTNNELIPVPIDKFLIWSHTKNPKQIFFYDYFPHIFYSPLDYKSDIQHK